MFIIELKVDAANSIFEIENEIVEVCYGCLINQYLDTPNIRLKEGYEDTSFYVIKDRVNNTFLDVINTKTLRSYTHYFKAVSSKYGKTETFQITFVIKDTIAPMVSNINDIIIDYGIKSISFKNYIEYSDNHTSKEDITLVVNDQSINYDIIGTYEVLIDLFDLSGNQTSAKIIVNIVDRVKPHIIQTNPLIIERNRIFEFNEFFIVKDNYHTLVDIIYDDREINYHEIGTYLLRVYAKDQSYNETINEYIVTVRDLEKPKIEFNYQEIYINVFDNQFDYYSPIKRLSDNGDLLSNDRLVVFGEVDLGKVDKYILNYELTDLYGNKTSDMMTVYVIDQEPPTITFEVLYINLYETNINYLDGVVVIDNYDPNVQQNLSVHSNNINVNEKGVYYINYECFDLMGNYTYETRSVVVYQSNDSKTNSLYLYIGLPIGIIIIGSTIFLAIKYKKKM